jgi:hypothetical protein
MSDETEVIVENTNTPEVPEEQTGLETIGNNQDPGNFEHIVIEWSDLPNTGEHLVIEPDDLPPTPSQVVPGVASIVIEVPDVNCSFCSSPIQPQESAGACKECHTPYHEACWKANHGCGVLNCSGRNHPEKFEQILI